VPDIKLDFSQVTYSGVLEIVAPVVPGSILAIGTLVLNPSLAASLLSSPYLGYRSRLVAAVFISYVAGLLLHLLVTYSSYFFGYMIGHLFGTRIVPNPPTPWRNLMWRKVARIFLGPDLAPSTDELYFKNFHEQELKKAELIQDLTARANQAKSAEEYFLPKSVAEGDWFGWYQVFSKYFATSQWSAPSQYFLSMLHTASWAVILLMVLNNHHQWLAWIFCLIGLFFGNGIAWFSGGMFNDPYGYEQTARLLRTIKQCNELEAKSEKESASTP
jgi:hypothetical protein